jgi:perosamine synthetase
MAKPFFNEEMRKGAIEALFDGRFVLGESVYKFEEEFARYCGVDCAVSARALCFLACSHQGGTF